MYLSEEFFQKVPRMPRQQERTFVVLSVLLHASELWHPLKASLYKLELFQSRATKWFIGESSCVERLSETAFLPKSLLLEMREKLSSGKTDKWWICFPLVLVSVEIWKLMTFFDKTTAKNVENLLQFGRVHFVCASRDAWKILATVYKTLFSEERKMFKVELKQQLMVLLK